MVLIRSEGLGDFYSGCLSGGFSSLELTARSNSAAVSAFLTFSSSSSRSGPGPTNFARSRIAWMNAERQSLNGLRKGHIGAAFVHR